MTKTILTSIWLLVFSIWFILFVTFLNEQKPIKQTENIPVENQEVELRLVQYGIASWYNYDLTNYKDYGKFNSTCASRFFKRGTMLKVKNIKNDKEVICRVNDYIEHPERVIDLSQFAFEQIAPLSQGLADVEITIVNN